MRNFLPIFIICFALFSCNYNHKEVLLTDPNVYESVEEISKELDSSDVVNFKNTFKIFTIMSEMGTKGNVQIVKLTGKRKSDLTLQDILDFSKSKEGKEMADRL